MYGWEMKLHQQSLVILLAPYNSFLNMLDSTQVDLKHNTQDLKEISNNGISNVEMILGPLLIMQIVKLMQKNAPLSQENGTVLHCFQNVISQEITLEYVVMLLSLMLTSKSNQSNCQKVSQSTFTTCHVSREKLQKFQQALIAYLKPITKSDSKLS